MVFIIRDDHKGHIQFLTEQNVQVVESFCKLSMDTLRNGSNPKAYEKAAQKLETEPDVIKASVDGLAYLFNEAAKQKVESIEFNDTLLTLGFNDDLQAVLLKSYQENYEDIRKTLSDFAIDIPHYKDIDWRVEAQVASRSLLQHPTPKPIITMRLCLTDQQEGKKYVTLQTDPSNLLHMTQSLEQALSEARGHYFRKVQRVIK